jgi:hypothetical protein
VLQAGRSRFRFPMRSLDFFDLRNPVYICKVKLPGDVLRTLSSKPSNFRKRVRKVIRRSEGDHRKRSEVK